MQNFQNFAHVNDELYRVKVIGAGGNVELH